MSVENIRRNFKLKNMHEARNYFIKEIDQNKSMS